MADIHPDVQNALATAFAETATGGSVVFLNAEGRTLFELDEIRFNAAAAGSVRLSGLPLDVDVLASGTAASFEVRNPEGQFRLRGTVTAVGGGGEAIMPNPTVTVGELTQIASLIVTMPASAVATVE